MVDSVFAPMSSMIVIHWAAAGRVGSVVVGKEESNCDSWGSALGGAEGTSPAMLRPVAPLHFFDDGLHAVEMTSFVTVFKSGGGAGVSIPGCNCFHLCQGAEQWQLQIAMSIQISNTPIVSASMHWCRCISVVALASLNQHSWMLLKCS